MGGRTEAYTPTDLVQKYYPWGYGAEDLPPWSQDWGFQTTGNQVDIWSPYFLRPDTDQFQGSSVNFDPEVDNRRQGEGDEGVLPRLPKALYGLMAIKVESRVDATSPDFPHGPFKYIYIFGGIDASGQVLDEMRVWNPAIPAEGFGQQDEEEGLFSQMPPLPTPRAYGQAVFVPGRDLKVALVGGIDQNGVALNTVDVFTFSSQYNPNGGTWETFEGDLPEALVASGAGYNPGYPGEEWVLALGGWSNEEDFSHKLYTVRLESVGNQVVREPIVVTPRSHVGSMQAGSDPLSVIRASAMQGPVIYNRYYVIGGVDENGVESIVETISLP